MSRPGTFTPGHDVTLRHGVWSERVTSPVVRILVDELLAARPDLERFPGPVWSWALIEARLLQITSHVNEHGIVDGKGRPRTTWLDLESRFARLAREARADLGLSPRSEADLARARVEAHSASFDLQAVIERGREIVDAKGAEGSTGYGAQLLAEPNGNGDRPEHAEAQP